MNTAAPAPSRDCKLLITRATWEGALRSLLLDENRTAAGSVTWNRHDIAEEALINHLDVQNGSPSGSQYPPLSAWGVVAVVRDGVLDVAGWIERLQPRASQTLTVLLIDGHDRRRWNGGVWRAGQVRPLASVQIVGGGTLQLSRDAAPGQPDPTRWSRLVGALGNDVVQRLQQANVLLVGAGRNGSLMAQTLTLLGIARLRLIDPDVLAAENLDAMPVSPEFIGRPKVEAVAAAVACLRPEMAVTQLAKPVNSAAAADLFRSRNDLIVSCVDSDARLSTSLWARKTLTVHLDVGTTVQGEDRQPRQIAGDARLLLPDRDGGCVACVGGLADDDQALYELAAPDGTLLRGQPVDWNQQRAGSLISINQLTVAAGVQLWLSLLSGQIETSFWQRLNWNTAGGLESSGGRVGSDANCRFCAENSAA